MRCSRQSLALICGLLLVCLIACAMLVSFTSEVYQGGSRLSQQDGLQENAAISSYWSYECPRNVPGHDVNMFDIGYDSMTNQDDSTKSSKFHIEGRAAKSMCSCGLGVAYRWVSG